MMNEMIIMDNGLTTNLVSENFIVEYTKSLTEKTREAYILDVRQFFGVQDLKDITMDQIKNVNIATANQYRESLIQKGYKINTINRKLTSLCSFYRILSNRMYSIVEYNPFDSKEGNKRVKNDVNYSTTRCLTTEETKAMIKACIPTEATELQHRDCIITMLLATTGMRREELCNICVGDFSTSMGKNIITIVGKGQKQRVVVVAEGVMSYIEKYLEITGRTFADTNSLLLLGSGSRNRGDKPLDGVTIRRTIGKIAKKAELIDPSSVTPHSFRHTFVTESLRVGARMEDVQDMVGHSSSNTTRRYDRANRVIENNTADLLASRFELTDM